MHSIRSKYTHACAQRVSSNVGLDVSKEDNDEHNNEEDINERNKEEDINEQCRHKRKGSNSIA